MTDQFLIRHSVVLAASLTAIAVEVISGQTNPAVRPSTSARAPEAAPTTWSVPRLPGGLPDLEGVWNYGTATPLERPAQWAGRTVLTEEDAAAWEKQNLQRRDGNTAVTAGPDWWEPQNSILKNR